MEDRRKRKELVNKLANIANLANQTLVGKFVEVFDSTNKSEIGIKGKCVEDLANVLVLETSRGEKKIIKANAWFLIYVDGYKVLIEGRKLVGRIEKRIKK